MTIARAFCRQMTRWRDGRAAFVCALCVLASAACGGSTATTTTIAGPTAAKCGVTIRTSATAFGYAGGSGTIDIDTARECEWNASSDAPWISLKPKAGQGGGTIQFSVAANEQPARRAAGILVNDRRVDLSEDPAPCRVQLAAARGTLGFDGGDAALSIATLNGCRWTATTTATWIQLRDPVSGSGNGEVRFHIPPNDGVERHGAIRVAESEQPIVQQAAAGPSIPPVPPAPAPSPAPAPPPPSPAPPTPAPSPVPPPPSCALQLDPASGDAAAAGGDGQIRVRAPDACPWTAVSQTGWIAITAGAAGKGNGEVRYRVVANTDERPRSASIALVDRSFIVRQAAALPPAPAPASCSFQVDPESEKFDNEGGDDRIRVRATDGCVWTASTPNGWIRITGGATGKGNGEVRYQVAANAGAARDGALNIAERTIRIRQQGAALRKVDVKGEIKDLQGACPKVIFSIDGTAVQTTEDTRYDDGSCASLRKGTKVKVEGLQSSNAGPIVALEIKLKDKDEEDR